MRLFVLSGRKCGVIIYMTYLRYNENICLQQKDIILIIVLKRLK